MKKAIFLSSTLIILFVAALFAKTSSAALMIILVGAPGSGKSHFAKALEKSRPSTFVRINQDELKTRKKCEKICRETIKKGKVPVIDRCNFDVEQRSHFLRIAKESSLPAVDCVVFEYSRDTLIQRCQARLGHETIPKDKAAKIVNIILGRVNPPNMLTGGREEGFREVTIVRSTEESDEVVRNVLDERPISARSKRPPAEATTSNTESCREFKKVRLEDFFKAHASSTSAIAAATTTTTTSISSKKAKPSTDGTFQIFCDLDGVLADFDDGVAKIFNGQHPDIIPPFKLWSGISRADKFYENLSMTRDGQELWDALVAATMATSPDSERTMPLPAILTGVPRNRNSRDEKFRWCLNKLGAKLDNGTKLNHVDMAGPKHSHTVVKGIRKIDCINIITCWSKNKHVESCPGAVLIDDREKFAKEWEKKGGIFIHHTSTATTLKKMKEFGILP